MLFELKMKVIHVPLWLGRGFREKVGTLKPLEKCAKITEKKKKEKLHDDVTMGWKFWK